MLSITPIESHNVLQLPRTSEAEGCECATTRETFILEESKHGACMELVGRAFFRQDLSRMRDISDTLFLGGVLLVGTLPFLRL
jgi:hypothetical protein